jgi:hypothetical protein
MIKQGIFLRLHKNKLHPNNILYLHPVIQISKLSLPPTIQISKLHQLKKESLSITCFSHLDFRTLYLPPATQILNLHQPKE